MAVLVLVRQGQTGMFSGMHISDLTCDLRGWLQFIYSKLGRVSAFTDISAPDSAIICVDPGAGVIL